MISIILTSYLSIICSVALGSIMLFSAGLYLIFNYVAKEPSPAPKTIINPAIIIPDFTAKDMQDIKSIAGDDVITTKLDLARAFIETGNKRSAKTILKGVVKQGNAAQQQEAQRLSQLL